MPSGDNERGSMPGRTRLIYLHGFRSSPLSFKAKLLGRRMTELGRGANFVCPQLPASPARAVALVRDEVRPTADDTLVGSSLGGYYATWLAERCGCRTVLLNPAVHAARDLASQVGAHSMYHDAGRDFVFEPGYVDELAALETGELSAPRRYLLVAATGDEVLDWREMVARYPGARHLIIDGSDHGLSDFESIVDEVLRFAGILESGTD